MKPKSVRPVCFLLLIIAFYLNKVNAGTPITDERKATERYKADPLAVKALDPVFAFYPDSSLIDFSFLLSPPAGKFGFVKTGNDGHFYFSGTGERARFWGVVITQEHIDIPKEQIEEVVQTLARAGINMVRFHAMDNRAGEEYGLVRRTIIEEGYPHQNDSRHFNPDYLDRLDYWIAKCKKRGIYVYLVLRGYRTFREGDGVPSADKLNRAARPYAMFNPRLIELQKEYARKFLVEHVNPYTGLSYANDPAVAAIEIFNEDSLFMRPDMWQNMVEPYLTEFRQLWNNWLKDKYGTTEKLRRAWTNVHGECALAEDESLERKNIRLPQMNLEPYKSALRAEYTDPLRSPIRRHDAGEFAIELQMKYLNEMKNYLREIGVKVPLTGVVDSTVVADTYTVGKVLDFTAENAYYEHPIFLPGQAWKSKAFYKNVNYMKDWGAWSLMPFVARYHWADCPVGVREWATCWPNEYRATSILEMSAYARLQDLDLLTYFAYYTTGDFLRIGTFNITCDPARWLLFGLGAKMFLSDDVSVAKHTVEIGYSKEDLLAWASFIQPHHCLGWLSKTVNRFLDDIPRASNKRALLITSGRTHNVDLQKSTHSLIFSNCPYVDFRQKEKAYSENNILSRSGYTLQLIDVDAEMNVNFTGLGLKEPLQKTLRTEKMLLVDDVKSKGYEPFGVSGDKCLGFYDANRKNLVFAYLPENEVPGFGAQLLNYWYHTPGDYFSFTEGENKWLLSDTGEIKRNTTLGLEIIDCPEVQVIQGELKPGEIYESSQLRIQTANDFGVFVAMSLDEKPLSESRYFVVKMVTRAWNRGQRLEKSKYPGRDDLFVLEDGGSAIVQTRDKSSEDPTIVWLNGRKLLECYMLNGWWEAVFEQNTKTIYLACSGRNIKFRITPPWLKPGEEPEFEMTRYYYDAPPAEPVQIKGDVIYPAFQKYIRLRSK